MKCGPYTLVVAPPDYPGKKYRNRYVYEHRLVWWKHTSEVAAEGFDIHHRNGDKRDNSFSNLELKSSSDHACHHNNGRKRSRPELECGTCRKPFTPDRNYWFRAKCGQRAFYCSRSCQVRAQWANRPISPRALHRRRLKAIASAMKARTIK